MDSAELAQTPTTQTTIMSHPQLLLTNFPPSKEKKKAII